MLKPIIRSGAVVAMLAVASAFSDVARAGQSFDFESYTCRDFLRATEPGQMAITLWYAGHYAKGPEAARRNLSEMLAVVPALRAACAESQSAKLVGVFEEEAHRRAEGVSE